MSIILNKGTKRMPKILIPINIVTRIDMSGSSVTKIPKSAFAHFTSLKVIMFPQSLIEIGDYAFECCSSITNIDLTHTTLEIVGIGAFMHCVNLQSITFPYSLRMIGYHTFVDCPKLRGADLSMLKTFRNTKFVEFNTTT